MVSIHLNKVFSKLQTSFMVFMLVDWEVHLCTCNSSVSPWWNEMNSIVQEEKRLVGTKSISRGCQKYEFLRVRDCNGLVTTWWCDWKKIDLNLLNITLWNMERNLFITLSSHIMMPTKSYNVFLAIPGKGRWMLIQSLAKVQNNYTLTWHIERMGLEMS